MIQLVCSECGKIYLSYPYYLKHNRKFCSRKCQFHKSLEQRFWEKVDKKSNNDECWNWIGAKNSSGYGQIQINKKSNGAYRLSYELNCGKIPSGLCVLHKCDNPLCVNPNHLFLGTHADNNADKEAKGRGNQPKGERNHFAKLKESQVLEIFNLRKQELQAITAKKYDITTAMVSNIQSGKNWGWLTNANL